MFTVSIGERNVLTNTNYHYCFTTTNTTNTTMTTSSNNLDGNDNNNNNTNNRNTSAAAAEAAAASSTKRYHNLQLLLKILTMIGLPNPTTVTDLSTDHEIILPMVILLLITVVLGIWFVTLP